MIREEGICLPSFQPQEFILIKEKPWVSQHGWAKPPECKELDS